MLKKRLLLTILGVISFLILLSNAGFSHSVTLTSLMPGMNQQMTQNQCQSSCTLQTSYFIPGQQIGAENKDLEPQLARPYFLNFAAISWPAVALTGIYSFWRLHWKPPDIFSLYAYYRIYQ